MKPLNEFLNEKKKSVDLKAVASYYGMSWFQFSSLSNKKIKEYKEMYIKHQEMNEGKQRDMNNMAMYLIRLNKELEAETNPKFIKFIEKDIEEAKKKLDNIKKGINESQSGQNLVDSLSKDIAHYTGLRVTAIIDFIGGDVKFAKKLFTFAKKGSLKDRLSITNAVLNGNKEFLNEGRFDYSNQQLLNFIESLADEQSHWGTQKMDIDDVEMSAEIVTDGDKYLVDAIIKYDKGVKDKKGAAKWLVDAVMSSSGNVSRQQDILARLRNSI